MNTLEIASGLTGAQRDALLLLEKNSLFRNRHNYGRRGLGHAPKQVITNLIRKGLAEKIHIDTPWSSRTFNVPGVRITDRGRTVADFILPPQEA